jgi:hypothetical protein
MNINQSVFEFMDKQAIAELKKAKKENRTFFDIRVVTDGDSNNSSDDGAT